MNAKGDTILGRAVAQTAFAVSVTRAPDKREERELNGMADVVFYGIAFVLLGLCLLYVRAADRL